MNALQKETYFLTIPGKAVSEKLGNQSVKILLPCGCVNVQNLLCGKPSGTPESNPNYALHQATRLHHFEFCKTHTV